MIGFGPVLGRVGAVRARRIPQGKLVSTHIVEATTHDSCLPQTIANDLMEPDGMTPLVSTPLPHTSPVFFVFMFFRGPMWPYVGRNEASIARRLARHQGTSAVGESRGRCIQSSQACQTVTKRG